MSICDLWTHRPAHSRWAPPPSERACKHSGCLGGRKTSACKVMLYASSCGIGGQRLPPAWPTYVPLHGPVAAHQVQVMPPVGSSPTQQARLQRLFTHLICAMLLMAAMRSSRRSRSAGSTWETNYERKMDGVRQCNQIQLGAGISSYGPPAAPGQHSPPGNNRSVWGRSV